MTPYELRFNNFYGPSFGIILAIYVIIIFGLIEYDKSKNEKLFNLLLTKLKLPLDANGELSGYLFLFCMAVLLTIITYIICHYAFIEKAANEKYPDKVQNNDKVI